MDIAPAIARRERIVRDDLLPAAIQSVPMRELREAAGFGPPAAR